MGREDSLLSFWKGERKGKGERGGDIFTDLLIKESFYGMRGKGRGGEGACTLSAQPPSTPTNLASLFFTTSLNLSTLKFHSIFRSTYLNVTGI